MSLGLMYDDGRESSDLPKDKRGLAEIDGGAVLSILGDSSLLDILMLVLGVNKSVEHHKRFSASASLGTMFPIYDETILGRFSVGST